MSTTLDEFHLEVQENQINKFIATIEQWKEAIEPYKRKAYLPIVQEVKMEFSEHSKIGGIPYLQDENDWPVCPNCQRNMDLLVQLNLNGLPEKSEDGLLQLFSCSNDSDEVDCNSKLNGWEPFSSISVVRKIQTKGVSAKFRPNLEKVFQEKRIVGWQVQYDFPHWEEYEKLGIQSPDDEGLFDLLVDRKLGVPIEKDKLFGWPYWLQGVEYPKDRLTGSEMEMLFQLVSMDNLAYRIGDKGIGHITQSSDTENELGFGWAGH